MKIQLLLTGNELMSGHTVDSNSATMAEKLETGGFKIYRKVTVGDDFDLLVSEMQQLSLDSDVLIVNGGLGPTIDDLTAKALSDTTGQPLQEDPEALEHLNSWCKKLKMPLNDANRKQAILPKGTHIIPNPRGSAVGFYMEHNNCLILCTPGVPSELRVMLDETILPLLATRFPNHKPVTTLRFQTFGLGESNFQQAIINDYGEWPTEVELGFRAGLPMLEAKLTITDPAHKDLQLNCFARIKELVYCWRRQYQYS